MDCRCCEYILCEVCCPRATATTTIWGAMSQLPFYALHTIEKWDESIEAAIDAIQSPDDELSRDPATQLDERAWEAFLNGELDDTPTFEQTEEAEALVADFCDSFPESIVLPTDDDYEKLWSRCSLLYAQIMDPAPIANELAKRLDAAEGDVACQRQLRALCALEHLRSKGAVGAEITASVVKTLGGVLRRLARGKTPGSSDIVLHQSIVEIASRLSIMLLGREEKLNGYWTHKDKPGFHMEFINGDLLQSTSETFGGDTFTLEPEGRYKFKVKGRHRCAELVNSELVWNNGDVWIRDTSVTTEGADEFMVVIDKSNAEDAKLGLVIAHRHGKELRIRELNEGLVMQWNLKNPSKKVMRGDCIYAVNGVRRNCSRMTTTITSASELYILVRRSKSDSLREGSEFEVFIEKDPSQEQLKLGLDVANMGNSLLIRSVQEDGLIHKWNMSNPGKQVKKGDCIFGVNGAEDTCNTLLHLLKSSTRLELWIRCDDLSVQTEPVQPAAICSKAETTPSEASTATTPEKADVEDTVDWDALVETVDLLGLEETLQSSNLSSASKMGDLGM